MNSNRWELTGRQYSYWRGWYIVAGIIILMCLGTVYSYSVFRMPIEELFDIGSTYSGMPYMMALAFYAIFMFLTGKALDRFHPRSILLCGGMLVAMGWSLSSMATSIPFLTLTYGVMSGAGVGIAYGVPLTVVARWFPDMKGLAVGMVLIGFGLSPIVTAPLSRMLVDEFGVMQAFLILGISFGVIITALSFVFKYPPK
ncbi:MAG: MFS transporter [Anaerolineaceae bacterium]